MITAQAEAVFSCDLHTVWSMVTDIAGYGEWRTDIVRAEILSERQFIEYAANGTATIFTTVVWEPEQRWEFELQNGGITGRWSGTFCSTGNGTKTAVCFIEEVQPMRFWITPFIPHYLKKQQSCFIADLTQALAQTEQR